MTDSEFETFHWKGQKRYRCPRAWENGAPCAFDHYDLEVVRQHAATPHNASGKAPATRRFISPIVDSRGETIVHEEPGLFKDVKFKPEEP